VTALALLALWILVWEPGGGDGEADLSEITSTQVASTDEPQDVLEPVGLEPATATPRPTAVPASATPKPPEATATEGLTQTPRPSPTEVPSNTPMPTPTTVPTMTPLPTPTPRPTLAPQLVNLMRRCGSEFVVEVGRPILLRYGGWVAIGVDLANDSPNHLTVELKVDGQIVYGYALPAIPASQLPCTDITVEDAYGVLRETTLNPLSAGRHAVEVAFIVNDSITDGFDSNGDGEPDYYGAGTLSTQTYTLISQ
jgi:hypothetical protein